jgi:hypothetical protein
VSTAESASADRTIVEFPASEGYRSVGRLVLGGVASRFELPVDRVDDLLLAIESLFMQERVTGTLRLEADASPETLRVRIGPLKPGRLDDPGLHRVLTRLVDEVTEQPDGDSVAIELAVSAAYRPATAT